jgi:hypothetical protein
LVCGDKHNALTTGELQICKYVYKWYNYCNSSM